MPTSQASAQSLCDADILSVRPANGYQRAIAVQGDLAYVGDDTDLRIFDVTDPTNPLELGGFDTGSNVMGIDVQGSLVYVVSFFSGLRILDVSVPSNPVVLGSLAVSGVTKGIKVVNGLGYMASNDLGLVVIDLTNPASPSILGTGGVIQGGNFKVPSEHFVIAGSWAYVPTSAVGGPQDGVAGCSIFDITDPANPTAIGAVSIGFVNVRGVALDGQTLFLSDNNGVMASFDVSNPASPVFLDSVAPTTTTGAAELVLAGSQALLGGNSTITAVDVSDPSNLSPVNCSLGLGSNSFILAGPLLYVAGRNVGFHIVALDDLDQPPVALAGADFSVNEGQSSVTLDGAGSSDPDGDTLAYAWSQVAGTAVTLSDATVAQPTFDAPFVAVGGETLTFELEVTANGATATDQVNVTVVNVNHPPVADAGDDLSIAEGSLVTLGPDPATGSFDVDNDSYTYAWSQVSGPSVMLSDAAAAQPTFTAPLVASGATATLVFSLTVDDGFPADAPAPGYSFADSTDSVTVTVTNVNNPPVALAGADQTVNENTYVALSGGGSDPDGDGLTYAWAQTGGSAVLMAGQFTATPSFTVPFVNSGGEALSFELTVEDGFGGSATDTVVVHVQNANDPPLVSAAAPTMETLWPPRHDLVLVGILGVSDPDDNATIVIDAVYQDEPTNGTGDGDTAIDAIVNPDGTVYLRAERAGNGDGRVYHVHFTASDLEGSASGVVTVSVSHKKKKAAVDGGALYDSTL